MNRNAPPPPPDNSAKKPGFFSSIATAVREISHEVKRDLNNLPPSGMVGQSLGQPTVPAAQAPGAAPAYVTPVAGVQGQTEVASFALVGSLGGEALPPAAVYATEGAVTEQDAEAWQLLTNPWPHLRNPGKADALRADAYYHAYTEDDLLRYARDVVPVTVPEIVSVVAVEAGEPALVERLAGLFGESPGVFGAVGFGPRNVQDDLDAMDAALTDIMNAHPQMIAVGPIGIDGGYSPSTLAEQAAQFVRQLEIAADFDVPAIIFHTKALLQMRLALDGTVLPRRLVWLKPIRDVEELDVIQQIDAYVVMRAELTHPKEDFYRTAIAQVLPQRLLIGSGNSLNAVHAKAGQFNSASSLPDILKVASEQLKMPLRELQARVNQNFASVYGAGE